MTIFTYHLAKTTIRTALGALYAPPTAERIPGLIHAECMASMMLGSPILSAARMNLRQLAVFAKWESESALEGFLSGTGLGRALSGGWHVRLEFVRRWGHVDAFGGLPENAGWLGEDDPVVAVTLARMKLTQVPRFLRWGKPVEELVRDHPGITLATAAIRPLHTVSTFSVWKSQREMLGMVRGAGTMLKPERHAAAMKERQRKDFHTQFITLRFRPLSEHGEWLGCRDFLPAPGAKA